MSTKRLQEILQDASQPAGDLIFDCRKFACRDPSILRRVARHIGSHDVQLGFVLRHKDFIEVLKVLRDWLEENTLAETLTIYTFCKRGEQRSVAVATLLKLLLREIGIRTPEPLQRDLEMRRLPRRGLQRVWFGAPRSSKGVDGPLAARDGGLGET